MDSRGAHIQAVRGMPGVVRARFRKRATVSALVALLLFGLVYWLMVRTQTGQRFEDAVLAGALEYRDRAERGAAEGRLRAISLATIGAGCVGVLLIAAIRHRRLAGVAGVCTIVGAMGVAEVLKRYVVTRPALYGQTDPPVPVHNSFPSGHTAIATSLLFALIIVAAPRWRGLAAAFGALWTVGIGASTVTAHWHRPADTFGGNLIAFAVGALALAALAALGRGAPAVTGPRLLLRLPTFALAGTACVGTVLAGLFLWMYARDRTTPALPADADWEAYLAGQSLASAFGALTALAMLSLVRRWDPSAPDQPRPWLPMPAAETPAARR
ncbi:phosphatase PAP2 family protein [Streptomyces sp. TRM66268-LWL]|uniref:Phosphatase PAP2 family protein n=1 Tax=Streptomyces polyasparticus TaxID=2767826 RepID=A0ABR7ST43_9ACTN|nr:phosphatase PAP2 family protein [Streptomyces polyasparticus]MBC9717508.1 phosphatase PAP2 family protein [Streptomyces polyasparticus]